MPGCVHDRFEADGYVYVGNIFPDDYVAVFHPDGTELFRFTTDSPFGLAVDGTTLFMARHSSLDIVLTYAFPDR